MKSGSTEQILDDCCSGPLTDERLRQLQGDGQSAFPYKRRFMEVMAYQIRTLSNAVIGFCDLLNNDRLSDIQKEYVAEISVSGKGLVALVSDMLDLARLESGHISITADDCSVSKILSQTEAAIQPAVSRKNIEFRIVQNGILPANIRTDAYRIQQCLFKLVSNAVKFTDDGYVHLNVSTDKCRGRDYIRFDVADSGRGLTAQQQQRIFEPYAEPEEANESVLSCLEQGIAVTSGLALANYLVRLMGGGISVVSEPGKGSVFSLIIPAGVDVDSVPAIELTSEAPENVERTDAPAQRFDGCVLLVEDEPSNRTVLSLLLETMGITVTAVADGNEAISQACRQQFDVILMDIKMPGLNGFETAGILRREGIKTPIIALSAAVDDIDEEKRSSEFFDSFLAKPVGRKKLCEVFGKYLDFNSRHSTAGCGNGPAGAVDNRA